MNCVPGTFTTSTASSAVQVAILLIARSNPISPKYSPRLKYVRLSVVSDPFDVGGDGSIERLRIHATVRGLGDEVDGNGVAGAR